MRFITADYLFPVSESPIKNGIVVVNDDGSIADVLRPEQFQPSDLKLETYFGIICPGFINSHCHLELSHLKGKFPERTGLPDFIGNVIGGRQAEPEFIQEQIAKAEDEMIANGIVAVGDICNTSDTIPQKKKSRLKYHSFIELFDLNEKYFEKEFAHGLNLFEEYKKQIKTVH